MKYFKFLFFVAILGALSLLCLRYPLTFYMDASNLSATTKSLLAEFKTPISITLKTDNIDLAHQVSTLIEKYQRENPHIAFTWQQQGNQVLLIENQDHQEKIYLNEGISEALLTKALFQFKQKRNQWIVLLQGHNEPSLYEDKATALSLFRLALENQGFQIKALNLQQTPLIPDNVNVLIIASPQSRLMPIEEALILDYLAKGKNLLWLTSPPSFQPAILSDYLGVDVIPGVIHDHYGQKLGTPSPTITIVSQFSQLPFPEPKSLCAFPDASALHVHAKQFNVMSLLKTDKQTSINQTTFKGPFSLGVLFTNLQNPNQRIAVLGNTRFLTNGVIQNYGNLAFGLSLIHWLNHNDIAVIQPVVENQIIHLDTWQARFIQYGFPCLSFLLLFSAFGYFIYRNKIP